MNNDLISRKWLTDAIRNRRTYLSYEDAKDVIDLIDNAPTVKTNEMTQDLIDKVNVNVGLAQPIKDERPQSKFIEMLKDRIEKSVCKYCNMNKHCELCEISRVFQIITLAAEEQKGGVE